MFSPNEEFAPGGHPPPGDYEVRQAIIDESLKRNMGYGTVHVYVVGPDGHMVAGIGVVKAIQNDNLAKFLEQIAQQLKIAAGPPLVKPKPQSSAPPSAPDSLILHVTARGRNEGSWREFPAEDWIVLQPAEWAQLLPKAAAVGTAWEIDPAITRKLLTHFHPQMEESNTRVDRNKFDKASLTGKVISVNDGVVRARLDGALQMKRTFYPGREDTLGLIRAALVGYLEFSPDLKHVASLELVTDKATWNDESFSAALRSGYEAAH